MFTWICSGLLGWCPTSGHWSTRPTLSSLSIVIGRRRSFNTPLDNWWSCFSGHGTLFHWNSRRWQCFQHLNLNWRHISFLFLFPIFSFLCTMTAVLCTIYFKFLIDWLIDIVQPGFNWLTSWYAVLDMNMCLLDQWTELEWLFYVKYLLTCNNPSNMRYNAWAGQQGSKKRTLTAALLQRKEKVTIKHSSRTKPTKSTETNSPTET